MSNPLFDLTGKRALITGGGTGLGLQLAEGLAEAGAETALCGRNVERCIDAAARIESSLGVRSIGIGCDIRDLDQIREVARGVHDDLGPIDILINNAGTSWGAPATDYPEQAWRKVLDVNLTGLFFFTQSVGREMIESGRGGKIINLTSVLAFRGVAADQLDAVAYNASKGGVVSVTRDLAVKWAPHGINVNAIAPGWFPTNMSQLTLERSGADFLQRIPAGRYGGVEDLKGVGVFLASRASDYVTGQTIVVDGGMSVA
jgi:NAD(P)-dependent dehydrogenase (short-subunit alcohol dehydrogenase family)